MDIRILHIDTATGYCSVALTASESLLAYRESNEKNAHAKNLGVFIREVFEEASLEMKEADALAISKGPGSYTGLRIGVSTAKGICYALEKPLVSVGTLQSMASGMASIKKDREAFYCPLIDARRMEVYSAVFQYNNESVQDVKAEIIDENSFRGILDQKKVYFFGDGAAKCIPFLENHPHAVFDTQFTPSARYMNQTALKKFRNKDFEDVAYFEPFYLKDFIAGKPRVKGLY